MRWSSLSCVVCIIIFLLWWTSPAYAEWQVRPKHRWQQIAQRLQKDYLTEPRLGYTLQRLLQHYRSKGGYRTLLDVLPKTASQQKPSPIPQTRLYLALGLLALQANDVSRAIAYLKDLLSPSLQQALSTDAHSAHSVLTTKDRDMLTYWTQAQFQSQQWTTAYRGYRLLLSTATTDKERWSWRQKLLLIDEKNGQWKAVLEHYQFLIQRQPKNPVLREHHAQLLLRMGQPLAAWAEFQALEKLVFGSQKTTLWLQMVPVLQTLQRHPEALVLLGRIRRSLTSDHWMHRTCIELEIQSYRQQKKLHQLLPEYHKRSRRMPAHYLPILPKLYKELGQTTEAFAAYRLLLRKYPKHADFQDWITLLQEHKQFTAAIQLLQSRLSKASADPRWAILLLKTFHLAQQPPQLTAAIQEYLPRYATQRAFLHKLLESSETWKLSDEIRLTIFEKFCPLPPQSASCYEQWGEVLWRLKQKHKALQVWESMLRIHPPSAQDRLLLAQIYKRHGFSVQSQSLLEDLTQSHPNTTAAQKLLAETYLRQRRPSEAMKLLQHVLTHTRQLSQREAIRQDILRTLTLQYHYALVLDMLRRDYWLSPLVAEPRKQLLLYFVQHPHRFGSYARSYSRIPVLRRHYRYPIYRRYSRYPHHRRYLHLSPGTAYRSYSPSLAYRTRETAWIPQEIRDILQEGFAAFPEDAELHYLAVRIYRNHPEKLPHLRRLLELDVTQLESYLPLYATQARRWKQDKDILPFLQTLTEKYPHHAMVWAERAKQALLQNKPALAIHSYQEALRLDAKPFAYHCGLAQTYAQQKQWQDVWHLLQKFQGSLPPEQQETRILQLVRAGLNRNLSSPQLLQQLFQHIVTTAESRLSLAFAFWKHRGAHLMPQEQAFFSYAIQQSRKEWEWALAPDAPAQQRYRAYLLLHRVDKAAFLARVSDLFQDPHPPLRMLGALTVALYQQQARFMYLDRLERTDPHLGVKYAASFAISGLMQKWRFPSLSHFPPAELWHGLLLPLLPVSVATKPLFLVYLSLQYRESPAYLRRHIFAWLRQLPATVVIPLNRMLESSQHRCFAFAALHFLRESATPSALRKAALAITLPKAFFYRYCHQQNLQPPVSLFHPRYCTGSSLRGR